MATSDFSQRSGIMGLVFILLSPFIVKEVTYQMVDYIVNYFTDQSFKYCRVKLK